MIDLTLLFGTIKSVFDFGLELLKFLQTPEGKQLNAQMLSDRAKWDSFWSNTGASLEGFFKRLGK